MSAATRYLPSDKAPFQRKDGRISKKGRSEDAQATLRSQTKFARGRQRTLQRTVRGRSVPKLVACKAASRT